MSSYVCPVDNPAEPFVIGVIVALDDVPADHARLLLVTGVVGAVQREVPQRGELRLGLRLNQDEFVGVQAISRLFATAQVPSRRSLRVLRCGLKFSQMIATRIWGG